jgi:hypothetical protein
MHHQRIAFALVASLAAPLAWALAACSSTNTATVGPADSGGMPPSGDDGGTASDDGGGTTSDGSVTLTKACADWAQARCARLDACSNSTYSVIHYGSQATCVANSAAQCATDLAAAQTASTPSFFEACAASITAESCGDLLGANLTAACAPLAGPIANGSPCFAASQCQSTYCAIPQYATCGACAAVPNAGDTCAVDADCGARNHLTCSKAGTCVAFGVAAGSCDKDTPCGPGLSCVGAKKTTPGACAASGSTVGATCDANQQTGPACDAELSLACDPATSMCTADTLVGASATCGTVDGGVARCESAGTCVIPTLDAGDGDDAGDAGAAQATTTGSCVAASANGAACDGTDTQCIAPAKCVIPDGGAGGTCQLDDPTTCH